MKTILIIGGLLMAGAGIKGAADFKIAYDQEELPFLQATNEVVSDEIEYIEMPDKMKNNRDFDFYMESFSRAPLSADDYIKMEREHKANVAKFKESQIEEELLEANLVE